MAVWNRKNTSSQSGEELLLAKIDNLVKQEKQRIDEACLHIGRQYAHLHSVDYEEVFDNQMRAIAVANEAIAAFGIQTLLITGAATCPKCGNNAPRGSRFCNQCGTPIPAIPYERYEQCHSCGGYVEKGQPHCPICRTPVAKDEEQKIQCPHCQEWVEKDNRFCPACGLSLTDAPKPESEQPKEKRCPKCGTTVPADMHFCTECGKKL